MAKKKKSDNVKKDVQKSMAVLKKSTTDELSELFGVTVKESDVPEINQIIDIVVSGEEILADNENKIEQLRKARMIIKWKAAVDALTKLRRFETDNRIQKIIGDCARDLANEDQAQLTPFQKVKAISEMRKAQSYQVDEEVGVKIVFNFNDAKELDMKQKRIVETLMNNPVLRGKLLGKAEAHDGEEVTDAEYEDIDETETGTEV